MKDGKAKSGDTVPGLLARAGALHLIGAVLERGAMLDEAGLDEVGLRANPAERAEARGLADLTLRRLGQIDGALGRFVGRMPKPPVNHVLRLMAAELIFAGTAPHAAVDLAVRLVKRVRGAAKLSGMVNAVGRRLAEQGAEIAAGQDAARLNTPPWLWKQLSADWGAEAARAMAVAHLTPAPHDPTRPRWRPRSAPRCWRPAACGWRAGPRSAPCRASPRAPGGRRTPPPPCPPG